MKVHFFSDNIIMNFGVFVFFLIFVMLLFMLVLSIKSLFIKKKWKKYEPKITIFGSCLQIYVMNFDF